MKTTKRLNKFAFFLQLIFAFISAVTLTVLAKIYQPELQVLPSVFFGFYIAVLIIGGMRRRVV